MKRSTNSENLIVVTAIAIAISLLASACGPGNLKTLKAKTGLKNFSDKLGTTAEDTQSDKQAIEELLTKGNSETPVDMKSAQDLATRLQYVQYLVNKDGSNGLVVSIVQNNKKLLATFDNGTVSEDGTTVEFSKAASVSGEATETNLSAKIIKQTETLARVFITEKSSDAKKASSEISLIVKLNIAEAQVTSNDDIILKMKDSTVDTRITQAYAGVEKIASRANRIMISVTEKETLARHYSLLSLLSVESNSSVVMLNNVSDKLKESFKSDSYTMSLEAGSAVLDAKQLSLKFVNNISKVESNVLLTLIDTTTAKEDKEDKKDEAAVDAAADASNSGAEDPSTDFVTDSAALPAAKADFSGVTAKVDSTEAVVNKADFSNVTSRVDSTEAIVKPDFSNVTSKVTTVPAKAPKRSGVIQQKVPKATGAQKSTFVPSSVRPYTLPTYGTQPGPSVQIPLKPEVKRPTKEPAIPKRHL